MSLLQRVKKNERLLPPLPYNLGCGLHQTKQPLIRTDKPQIVLVGAAEKRNELNVLKTFAREIGLAKHWSKCISSIAFLHRWACITPCSVSTERFELPYTRDKFG